jgi:hypothetical protein
VIGIPYQERIHISTSINQLGEGETCLPKEKPGSSKDDDETHLIQFSQDFVMILLMTVMMIFQRMT